MTIIKEIKARSILTPSRLAVDYVINPYVGCMHGCIYCYARFMKRFTNHPEPWGEFVDVRTNAADLLPKITRKGKSVLISSVTDPYQPLENKYQLMPGILRALIPLNLKVEILTKSSLVLRDIELIKQIRDIRVGVSMSSMDEEIQKQVEPGAMPPESRLSTLKALRDAGIKNFLFISPILPHITDWKAIVNESKGFIDELWFENLNVRAYNWPLIQNWLKKHHPELLSEYQRIYFSKNDFWDRMKKEIFLLKGIKQRVFFHL
jgi:DNA repair photolyase